MESVDKIPSAHREYLQAIFALEEGGIIAIQARIGDWLGVSRASVSEMVRKLHDAGIYHADLHIKNILDTPRGYYFIDFDGAKHLENMVVALIP